MAKFQRLILPLRCHEPLPGGTNRHVSNAAERRVSMPGRRAAFCLRLDKDGTDNAQRRNRHGDFPAAAS